MINHYELLYLIPANYTEEELGPIKEKISSLIKKFEGEISYEDNFGKKKLAYPIKNNHQGYYLISEFDLEGSKLKDLEKNIGLTNEVLRHIIVKKELQPAGMRVVPTLNMDEIKFEPRPKTPETKVEPKPIIDQEKEKDKLKLEDLDEKLDEILEGDIMR